MPKTFLEAAEIVLLEVKKPLTPLQIYKKAEDLYLLQSTGNTPEHSMKARISTDIANKQFNSIFMRTGPNRFALREWGLKEYVFPRPIPYEVVSCIESSKITNTTNLFGFSDKYEKVITILSNAENITCIDRRKAEENYEYKQIISYVLLSTNDGKILTYVRGSQSSVNMMLKGSRCLGFGGHVQERDTKFIFNDNCGGVINTAIREVYEELKGIHPHDLSIAGYINDDSSPEGLKHIGIVVKGKLPNDFNLNNIKKEQALNGLQLYSIDEIWSKYHEFEYWSQLLIKGFFQKHAPSNLVTILPTKFNLSSNIYVIIGEIASGKTVLCEMLNKKLNFHSISTRTCISQLINVEDFGVSKRTKFQIESEKFINTFKGPKLLATEIKNEIDKHSGIKIVDGIRQLRTLKELKKFYPDLITLYIESTRDDAFRNFNQRTLYKSNLFEFRNSRFHPVEKEIPLLKFEADVYIFNGGNKEQLYKTFINWFNTNKK